MEYIKDIAKIKLYQEKCIGCGICKLVCPHSVFELKEKKAYLANKDRCIECGACDINCPTQAIEVEAGVGCANALIKDWLQDKKDLPFFSLFNKLNKKDDGKPGCC